MKHKPLLHVKPAASGAWTVTSSAGSQLSRVYPSKPEAVSAAWRDASAEDAVIVRTATGQIVRPPVVKTTRDARSMREAVLTAVRQKQSHR